MEVPSRVLGNLKVALAGSHAPAARFTFGRLTVPRNVSLARLAESVEALEEA